MNEHKIIKSNFPLSDFEEEQQFLSSQHADGWKLLSIAGKRYTFEKCDKEAFVYQIDFNPDEREKDEYIQLYTDFGWQFITEKEGRFYFCKSALPFDENKIFSDRETKAVMCHKIIKRKMIRFIPLSIITLLIIGLLIFYHQFIPLGFTAIISMIFIGWLILTLYSKNYLYGLLKVRKILKDSE